MFYRLHSDISFNTSTSLSAFLYVKTNVKPLQAKEPNGEHAEGTPEGTPLADVTNEPGDAPKDAKSRPRVQKQRGPPEDGIPSKTKVMVANLPYDLSEEKVHPTYPVNPSIGR